MCFYIRLMGLEDLEETRTEEEKEIIRWFRKYPLSDEQRRSLVHLSNAALIGAEENILDDRFHDMAKSLFCWIKTQGILEESECAVQRFLIVLCMRKEGRGFINVREITPLIAKLSYCVRAITFTELLKREMPHLRPESRLDGLEIFIREQIQTPFGLLRETMHLASMIAGDISALPQIILGQ